MTQPSGTLSSVTPGLYPAYWDKLILGGVQSPGFCKWSGWKRKSEWDKKKGKGVKGSIQTLKQLPEAEGEFTFYWGYTTRGSVETPEIQDAQWDNFSTLLGVDAGKKTPTAINVFHPALATLVPPVTSVFVQELGPIEIAEDGMRSCTVKFSEYLPAQPQNIATTPNTSTNAKAPNSPGVQPPPVQDANQLQIAALLEKAQNLP